MSRISTEEKRDIFENKRNYKVSYTFLLSELERHHDEPVLAQNALEIMRAKIEESIDAFEEKSPEHVFDLMTQKEIDDVYPECILGHMNEKIELTSRRDLIDAIIPRAKTAAEKSDTIFYESVLEEVRDIIQPFIKVEEEKKFYKNGRSMHVIKEKPLSDDVHYAFVEHLGI